jgi:flagellin
MSNTATSASFSSVNWLSIDSANSTKNSTNIVSSFSRSTTGVSTGSIAVSLSTNAAGAAASGAIALYDTNTGGSKVSVNATGTVAADATATGSIKLGILDRARIGPGATSAVTGIAGITVSSATTSTQLSDYLSMVDQALNEVTTGQSTLGAASSRITLQQNFISSLSDAVTKGVGSLQDADMNQASTQLQALQVQQQLGVQSLSIANQNSQMILKLFNG